MASESPIRPYAYNPHLLSDQELEKVFIARQDTFKSILSDIDGSGKNAPPSHHLVIGQRGMGKSTLLRRLGVELRKPAFRDRFVPLNFAEEQHVEIDRLSRFWLNCLDSLADTLEAENQKQPAEELDAIIDSLDTVGEDEADKELAAREALLEQIETLGRRPVLFIDNLHLLIERLSKASFALRGFFTKPGAPIIVGASTVSPHDAKEHRAAFNDHAAAFYDGFKPRTLHRLSVEEVRAVIAGLAHAANNKDVLQKLPRETGRLHALRDLTGGNPRTAFLLYDIFARELSDDIFHDLERLLDGITPLYQSYLEQLTELAQVIVGVLARNQRPLTAKAVTDLGGLNRSSVSPQLGRLEDIGLVERVPLHGTKKEGYQLAERFFNLWFILRFSSRRERARLRCLARFLKDFYTPQQLAASASAMLRQGPLRGSQIEMALALQEILGPEDFKAHQLRRKAHLEFIEEMNGVRAKIAELIDLSEIEPRTFEFAELKSKLRRMVPAKASITPDAFVDLVLESPNLLPNSIGQLDRSSIAQSSPNLSEFDALVTELQAAKDQLLAPLKKKCRDAFTQVLRDGIFQDWADAKDLEQFLQNDYHDTLFDLILKVASTSVTNAYPQSLTQLLIDSRFPESTKNSWPAITKFDELGWHAGSIHVLRSALQTNPKDTAAWNNLGVSLQNLELHEESERAYLSALKIDPNSAYTWSNFGTLLQDHLGRYDESEMAYRNAIKIDPRYSWAWNGLGNLMQHHLGRYDESEKAYRNAIEIDPNNACAWSNLGSLLQYHHGRYDESEEAYLNSIKIDSQFVCAWVGLGNLQSDGKGRFKDAQRSFRKALKFDPGCAMARHNIVFILRDFLGEQENAHEVLSETPSSDKLKDTEAIQHALFAAYNEDWGQCANHLRSALKFIGTRLPADTKDDWFRAAAVLLHLGYGPQFISLLQETGAAVTLLPFFEAVQAHVMGNRDSLMNIEPEARPVAQNIYDHIERRRALLPESTRR